MNSRNPSKKWPLRKNVGHRGDINRCWYLVTLGRRTPEGGEEGRSQMIGWGPKTEVAPFSPSAKKTRRNVSCLAGFVAGRRTKASIPGWRQKNIWDTREPRFFKPVFKISLKSISPWKKKDSPVEPRRKIKISNFGTIFSFIPKFYIPPSLSLLSQFEETKEQKRRKIFMSTGCSIIICFDTLKVYIIVVKDSCIFMLPRGLSCSLQFCYEFVEVTFPFQLLFALCYLA